MDTSELAILTSIFSIIFAAISLGWNIYRDVVLKPKVVVDFSVKRIISIGVGPSPDYICISATNHGPGPVNLMTILLRGSSLWKRITKTQNFAVLLHDYKNPHSDKMPRKLEVGESLNWFVDYDKDCFLKDEFTRLGISDSFGRTNWAPRKRMSKLRNNWSNKFTENT